MATAEEVATAEASAKCSSTNGGTSMRIREQ
jgi:hypothetical protein